ncbi:hypothetical protein Cadr_000031130 [Camelus dromedarius]|uniref:Uncharacterized protein n=1 Tax=Camelus dromedarius TaxID=9838 RepID=A0A5N4BXB5_CAMDR|nr:hypothetical protein Cadr_000031130 [Camelus dromedarius]
MYLPAANPRRPLMHHILAKPGRGGWPPEIRRFVTPGHIAPGVL